MLSLLPSTDNFLIELHSLRSYASTTKAHRQYLQSLGLKGYLASLKAKAASWFPAYWWQQAWFTISKLQIAGAAHAASSLMICANSLSTAFSAQNIVKYVYLRNRKSGNPSSRIWSKFVFFQWKWSQIARMSILRHLTESAWTNPFRCQRPRFYLWLASSAWSPVRSVVLKVMKGMQFEWLHRECWQMHSQMKLLKGYQRIRPCEVADPNPNLIRHERHLLRSVTAFSHLCHTVREFEKLTLS